MKRRYELEDAIRLLPLLESIQREIDERSVAIQGWNRRIERMRENGEDEIQVTNAVAELATHKRELRHALEELEPFGCVAEPGPHTEIHIPGPDGTFEHGFHLDAQGNLQAGETASA